MQGRSGEILIHESRIGSEAESEGRAAERGARERQQRRRLLLLHHRLREREREREGRKEGREPANLLRNSVSPATLAIHRRLPLSERERERRERQEPHTAVVAVAAVDGSCHCDARREQRMPRVTRVPS